MISVERLTKRYGSVVAVQDLSFEAPSGAVTGFIGPNGSGKSTTIRAILGLDRPTSGRALVGGVEYSRLAAPARVVGAVTDPHAVQLGRTARDQLRWAATAAGVASARVDEVLDLVGLGHAASRRISALSLGMRQRLAIGVALLGEPEVFILDEPLNGLDPSGIVWVRSLLRGHAEQGGTVLVSSHMLKELQETADRVVLIDDGRLITEQSMDELTRRVSDVTRVVSEEAARLVEVLQSAGATILSAGTHEGVQVTGLDSRRIGQLALQHGIALIELTPQGEGLEAAFLELTGKEKTR